MDHEAASAVTATSSSIVRAVRIAAAIAAVSCASSTSATALRNRGAVATVTATVSSFASASAKRGGVSAVAATSNGVAIPKRTHGAIGRGLAAATVTKANAGVRKFAESTAYGVSSAIASAEVIRIGLTVCDVVRDILLCWGIEQPCSAPKMAKIAALNVLNNGMQVLWNQAKDRNYWTQSTISIAFTSGTDSVVMDQTIQNVIGPARLSTGEPLVPLANISESESFSSAFLEESSPTRPVGYFVERNNQSGADPAKCTMILSPVPSSNITVRVDVVKEAPRYTILDLDSCALCPVPHKYVESILMPVCRYLSMHSHLYTNRESEKTIERAYIEARRHLDVADPLPGQSGENSGYRKEERDKA